jgi:hypothetical protein
MRHRPGIVVGLVAGRGIGPMALRVMEPIYSNTLVDHLYMVVGEPPDMPDWLKRNPKVTPIYHTVRKHADLGLARNAMLNLIESQCDPDWLLIGDEDGLVDRDFFQVLNDLSYPADPVLLTGKMRNMDVKRWYDICGFIPHNQPVAIPYDDWRNPRWDEGRYANGGQHILNRSARKLGVRYQDRDGEDPHFCWDFILAGGRLQFEPGLAMTLAKQHGPCYVF